MKYPCYIEFSASGKLAILVHKNMRTLGRFVVHGPLADVCDRIHRGCSDGVGPEFAGEVFGLASYERIDAKSESVRED